ncbi:MAG: hypothetical protein V3T88_08760 [Nitrosomonadaceae bacterium]
MKKKNWKARLLSLRTLAMAEIEENNKIPNPDQVVAGKTLILLGRLQIADQMLAEYGVEVKDKPRIVLAS